MTTIELDRVPTSPAAELLPPTHPADPLPAPGDHALYVDGLMLGSMIVEAATHTRLYETASWYATIETPTQPVHLYLTKSAYDGWVARYTLNGTLTQTHTPSSFGGVQYGNGGDEYPNTPETVGKAMSLDGFAQMLGAGEIVLEPEAYAILRVNAADHRLSAAQTNRREEVARAAARIGAQLRGLDLPFRVHAVRRFWHDYNLLAIAAPLDAHQKIKDRLRVEGHRFDVALFDVAQITAPDAEAFFPDAYRWTRPLGLGDIRTRVFEADLGAGYKDFPLVP